jgi:hypothetical protein
MTQDDKSILFVSFRGDKLEIPFVIPNDKRDDIDVGTSTLTVVSIREQLKDRMKQNYAV